MAVIDDKVVAMSFESSKFIQGVDKTIYAIDALKKALNFSGAGKSLTGIGFAAKQIDLGHISKGVDSVVSKLGALRLSAIAVFAKVAGEAVAAGAQIAKAFTIDPMRAGFAEYTTNLNAVQTILANTQAAGVGLKEVNATLNELNRYSDKTIYNFSQMAKNIGTFTAAGVDLKTATGSIKGIANLAALSGSSAEQAATAMYQLSQAISAGRVNLMDWNSVVNAGMGGTVFQRALAQTAEAMGTLKKGTVELVGPMKNVKIAGESFRASLSAEPGKESWLTSDVLTTTLKQFTGDLKDAELAAMGFNAEQIKAIQQTAKTAMHAATEVKTLSQVLTVAKETAGSGWAQTWQIIFGNFTEAKTSFTNLSNAINGFINTNAKARNKVLSDWKALGGRKVLIQGLKAAFVDLTYVLKPIKDAFRDIFPAQTGKSLYDLTVRFRDFMRAIKPSPQTIAQLRLTFQGVFAVLHIGVQIIQGLFSMFGKLFGTMHENRRGILDFTSGVGQFLVSLDEALQKGNRLTRFFEGLGNVFSGLLKIVGAIANSFKSLFSGFSSGGFSSEMTDMSGATEGLGKAFDKVLGIFEKFVHAFTGGPDINFQPFVDSITEAISGIGPAIGKAASQLSFDPILQVIKTGLFAALVVMLKGFLGKGAFTDQLGRALGQNINAIGGGLLKNVSGSFKALEGSLVSMQTNIKAKTLKEIAIAVGILAASVIALSFVDPKKLGSSLTAMTVAFGQLIGAMALLTIATRSAGFIKLPLMTAGLILLAGAIDLLSLSVLALSILSWEDLAKGLAGVGAMLAIVSAAAVPLSKGSGGLIRAGLALIPLAIGLRILSSAVGSFADMKWSEMARGMAGIGAGLAIIAGAMHLMPKSTVVIGVGLAVVAASLKLLANVVMDFADMSWTEMGKGMAGIASSLIIIGGAMRLFPKSTILIAAGLIGVVGALSGIAKLVKSFGSMSPEQLAKGLGSLAASLGILAAALYAMSGGLAGATALGIAATSLALLVPSILMLGRASWGKIIKGLVVLAATITILGVAGMLLVPALPGLLGLGVALVLIGAGFAALGAGMFLIASAFGILVTTIPTGIGIMIAAFNELMAALPEMTKNFVLGLLEIVNTIAIVAPQFVEGILKIIEDIVGLFVKAAPTIALAFGALLGIAVKVITDYGPRLIQAGFNLLMDLLQGIKNNISKISEVVTQILARFISAVASKIGQVIAAGSKLFVAFLKGVGDHISNVVTVVGSIITKFLSAIANSLPKIATAGISILTKFLNAIANHLPDVVTAGGNIIIKLVKGIGDQAEKIATAARKAAGHFIKHLASEIVKLEQDVFDAIILLINGMATTIEQNDDELRAAGKHLGWAIINGMTLGLAEKAAGLYRQVTGIAQTVANKMHIPFVSKSPSRLMMELGRNIMLGMSIGLDDNAKYAYDSATAVSNGVIRKFTDTFQIASPSKVMVEIGKAVGEGFAKGIRGSSEDIKNAFTEMNSKLLDEMTTARETIASETEKLNKLLASKKQDTAEIRKTQELIRQNEELLKRSNSAHILLTKGLKDEKLELIKLANQYDVNNAKLDDANAKLVEAIRERKELRESLEAQYAAGPELSGPMTAEITDARANIAEQQAKLNKTLADSASSQEDIANARASLGEAQASFNTLVANKVLDASGNSVDVLATYMQALTNQTSAVGAYTATLEQLRKLGIDKTTYDKLVREGTADQSFANQLLAGGKTAVKSLNTLDSNLTKVSKTLATNAASNLKDAGVKSAQGLVAGLKSEHDEIRKEMEEIARMMIRSLKKELGIKSPSTLFAEIGRWSMAGMAKGFADSKQLVTDAVDQAAQDALLAMKNSMRGISDMVTAELNPQPVITPILDLTQVRTQAQELSALTNVVPITAATSYGQASMISTSQSAAQNEPADVALAGTQVKFEQNNYSPDSLSEIEIYRQTRNQLSQLKSVLAIT